ncbi:tyrosine phosphatase family protein [Roseiarcus sp.]|uniref:tyrosine phosphatase family protein n=1 Tax=Roseiarcus sp. TaxID=1969460 RepID=UPI003F95D0FE
MNGFALSTLTICGLHELDAHGARDVTHVLSLLDPGTPEPTPFSTYDPHVRATLYFHDAIEPAPNIVLPEMSDVETILAFARDAGDMRHLLIHCHMGISRSTAAMLMVLAQTFPGELEVALVDRLMEIRPQSWPNSRMIEFADERLGRNGRLAAAVSRIYARHLARRPDLAEAMLKMDRAREVELGRRSQSVDLR